MKPGGLQATGQLESNVYRGPAVAREVVAHLRVPLEDAHARVAPLLGGVKLRAQEVVEVGLLEVVELSSCCRRVVEFRVWDNFGKRGRGRKNAIGRGEYHATAPVRVYLMYVG
jgi:hypothetical protein